MYESEFLRQRQRRHQSESGPRCNDGKSDHHHHSNNNNKDRQRSPPKNDKQKHQSDFKRTSILLLTSLSGLGLWYTTPISDWLITFLLYQVPVESDVTLGRAALVDFPYPTIYHPRWSPMVEKIGRELITTLEASSTEVLREAGSRHDLSPVVKDLLGQTASLMMKANGSNDQQSQLRQYQWDFGVVKADIVNAFALPGGIIRVTDKLLETLSPSRGELASLLGHEIGHCFFRHSQKRVIQQQLFELVIKAMTYEDGDDYEENFGEAMGELLLKSAHWFGQQKFSRSDEYQADQTGFSLLLESQSYNPKAVQSLLEKLWSLNGNAPSTLMVDWMNTHPATEDRIEALRDKWQHLDHRERRRLGKLIR